MEPSSHRPNVSQLVSGLARRGHGSGASPGAAAPALSSPVLDRLRVFWQLYHACNGPGLSVLCFVRHDILEYFSVYGTALSMWVSLMGEWPPLVAQTYSQGPVPPPPRPACPRKKPSPPPGHPHPSSLRTCALSWASEPSLIYKKRICSS